MTRGRRRRVAVFGVVFGIVVAACGVETQDNPVKVDRSAVPFGLLEAEPTTTTSVGVGSAAVVVYWGSPTGLVGVTRRVTTAPLPARAFDELLAGPTPAEAAAGLTTELDENDVVLVGVRRGRAAVRLGADLAPTDAVPVEAIAQIVLTLTDTEGVQEVVFLVGSRRVEVPRADGSLTSLPVSRGDYSSLLRPA